ncbi:MAG: WD40 repeat domain-containing protein [Nitrospirae bacterium]|nr:WD40 repeat domain-containing protein [Nitrospirota bacterium]
MKKLLIFLALFLSVFSPFTAQSQSIKLIKTFGNYNGETVLSVDISPDGKKILSGHDIPPDKGSYLDKGHIKLWDISNSNEIFTFTGHSRQVKSVAFSPDGLTAASASIDGTIRVWDVTTGNEVKVLRKVQAKYSLAFTVDYSPSGKELLVGTAEESTLKLLNVNSGDVIKNFNNEWNIKKAVFSNNGKYALSIQKYDSPMLWDINSGKLIKTFTRQKGLLAYLFKSSGAWICGDLSPQAKYVAAGSSDGVIRIWGVESEKELWSIDAHNEGVNDIVFSPDGNLVLSTGNDGKVNLWDTHSGKMISQINLGTNHDYGEALKFSPDGSSFIVGTMRGIIMQFAVQN